MRNVLSKLLAQSAIDNPQVIVLTGDHGYFLFDELRKFRPDQFINCGIAEQNMIGIAAGLAKQGFKPIIYGLASFIPMRVLEQIKLDLCFPSLPVLILGDGAGLVYAHLGTSHHSAEDLAVLRPLPNLSIYAPSTVSELDLVFQESLSKPGPSYIRLGKADLVVEDTQRYTQARVSLVSMGSLSSIASKLSNQFKIPYRSIFRIKPFSVGDLWLYDHLIVLEEHSRYGGLTSALLDAFCEDGLLAPRIHALTLKDQFANLCGSYQYALSEHDLSDVQITKRVEALLKSLPLPQTSPRSNNTSGKSGSGKDIQEQGFFPT